MTNIEATLDQLYGLIASVRDNGAYPAEGFVKDILTSFEKEIRKEIKEDEGQKWQGNYDRCIEVVKM